ncbi:hypothetical protein [Pseudomonas typographi]|uniref:Secreted protein n=1 Tax=Pseudomonas typographi TaxID=2715964 RepID=A0ABR7Z199_9PSED|nr:hypothetical protein [Pseudomonas typographi]MBD1599245.1 hypothetical protein [Pseudomonas typographi]
MKLSSHQHCLSVSLCFVAPYAVLCGNGLKRHPGGHNCADQGVCTLLSSSHGGLFTRPPLLVGLPSGFQGFVVRLFQLG